MRYHLCVLDKDEICVTLPDFAELWLLIIYRLTPAKLEFTNYRHRERRQSNSSSGYFCLFPSNIQKNFYMQPEIH